jgi:hypothetical protein
MFSVRDKFSTAGLAPNAGRLICGRQGPWQAGGGRELCRLVFRRRQVAEISTLPDQFVVLMQIGYLRDEVSAAVLCPLTVGCEPPPSRRRRPSAPAAAGHRLGSDLGCLVAMSTRRVGWRQPRAVVAVAMNRRPFSPGPGSRESGSANGKLLHVQHGQNPVMRCPSGRRLLTRLVPRVLRQARRAMRASAKGTDLFRPRPQQANDFTSAARARAPLPAKACVPRRR